MLESVIEHSEKAFAGEGLSGLHRRPSNAAVPSLTLLDKVHVHVFLEELVLSPK